MRLKSVLCSLFALSTLVAGSANAQTLITFDTRAEAGSIAGLPVDANVASGSLARGAGVTLNAGGTYNSASWQEGTDLATAITNNNYYSFTVNMNSGSDATVNQIIVRYDRSGTGPSQLALLSSVTGFTALSTPIFTDAAVDAAGEVNTITVSGHTALAAVEFRLYCWGATAAAGTFDIEVIDGVNAPLVGIVVNGTSGGGNPLNGACCAIDGGCTVNTLANCSGTFQGVGTLCSPNPCPQPIGACCVNGLCVSDQSQADCLANGTGSSWGGVGTTCGTFSCPLATGSCCDTAGVCTVNVPSNNCAGAFTVNGTCSPNLCDDGACCNPVNGSCFLAFDLAQCNAVLGNFLGIGTICVPNPCTPVAGACCSGPMCALSFDPLGCRANGVFLGVGTVCNPGVCDRATGTNLVAKYDFDVNVTGGGSRNLTFTTSVVGPFPTGDQFGVAQRFVDPNLPFGLLDDSVFLFNNDTLGVIPESKVDSWFGVVDLFNVILPVNPSFATATWTFDISNFSNLSLSIDAAAMGDFETLAGCSQPPCIDDYFTIAVSIDNGAPVALFTAATDEAASQSYTMADGFVVMLNDPLVVTGSTISPLALSNVFQTLMANIAGTGSTLTVTLTAFGDGADEGYAFDNMMIMGTPVGVQSGACCAGNGECTITTQVACTGTYSGNGTSCTPNNCPQPVNGACCTNDGGCTDTTAALCSLANGSFQGVGSVCIPNPCAPATGACCCGSNCSITTAAACTGTNRSFVGNNSVCTPYSLQVPCCRGDYNKSGSPTSVQDIFDFLSGYFSGDTCADTNDSGGINSVQDIFDFLSAYFSGC